MNNVFKNKNTSKLLLFFLAGAVIVLMLLIVYITMTGVKGSRHIRHPTCLSTRSVVMGTGTWVWVPVFMAIFLLYS